MCICVVEVRLKGTKLLSLFGKFEGMEVLLIKQFQMLFLEV